MVRINETCSVMPDMISEVTCSYDSRVITVRLRSGVGHKAQPEYGESVSQAYDKLINKINEALE